MCVVIPGATPYSDVCSSEVASRVCRGLRLPAIQAQFAEEVHSLMLDCWQVDQDERPDFQQVVDRLQQLEQIHQTVVSTVHYSSMYVRQDKIRLLTKLCSP